MKLNYWTYYLLAGVFLVLFFFLTKENGERRYAFLGLSIGAVLRGVYEMYQKNKTQNSK